jgi:Ni/Co efflux regulator RcnB
MKKVILLLATCAFTTAAIAQTAPTTEVKVRDNGTEKVVTKTGKTNAGQALENTADATKNVAKKAGHKIKHGTQKLGSKVKHGTRKMEAKTE